MDQVSFIRMEDGTAEDYALLDRVEKEHNRGRIGGEAIALLERMRGPTMGYKIDRYRHSLQSATRALRDGREDDYVVMALLHDIGDVVAPDNHSDFAAAVLRPYVGERAWWIVQHHGIFQGYYYFHHYGQDRNERERFRGHPWFDDCAEFCALYDQNCFDPAFDDEPLETFLPLVERVFAQAPWRRV
ncbi:Predicted HD phosphohydrolase [Tistlia consotensis]|uniref:Predicted HD phosphohydrolase n=1 Tax=Tistlia consotensis USBA 355 TaxID=560819 RepID=A0A1Y6BMW2_9PROT|nr:HD domain-containing protein [Tistlia consotensis]SMF17811.1 Predicted HD phosphohydrolase [Tistlia consotensis USBA 355]SNR40132.1 Predicted HD phosphohydrolase [Tistlia consotensis]